MSERSIKEKLEQPIIYSKYQYAMDTVANRLKVIGADLTEQHRRPIIQNISGRLKSAERICKKLEKKNADLAVLNDVKHNDVFGSDTNVVSLVTADAVVDYPKMSKLDVANLILDRVLNK